MAAHTRDVNILIWTARKSVGHGTNDLIMVHGDGTRADGRRSKQLASISEMVGPRDQRWPARRRRRPRRGAEKLRRQHVTIAFADVVDLVAAVVEPRRRDDGGIVDREKRDARVVLAC